ncbi:hypothetical protein I79_023194 [Cricetulus griseus]|uniref:Uncharacterized protein n=1 Tax=Cricetulus griseus TaxID=10029 RepID=G3IHA6_CRIGR|nr:hypothetical protein I79_023194 [Cricetulus griseus]
MVHVRKLEGFCTVRKESAGSLFSETPTPTPFTRLVLLPWAFSCVWSSFQRWTDDCRLSVI